MAQKLLLLFTRYNTAAGLFQMHQVFIRDMNRILQAANGQERNAPGCRSSRRRHQNPFSFQCSMNEIKINLDFQLSRPEKMVLDSMTGAECWKATGHFASSEFMVNVPRIKPAALMEKLNAWRNQNPTVSNMEFATFVRAVFYKRSQLIESN